jgi:hypothetical protein
LKKTLQWIIFLSFSLNPILSLAYGGVVDNAAHEYFRKLEASGAPVFFAACKTKIGTAVIFFGLHEQQGMLFETHSGYVVNSAPVILKRDSTVLDVEETQGGIYTYTIMQNHAKDLTALPFKFAYPKNLYAVIRLKPTETCVEKPPAN